ncbi:hypothetical protein [Longimicrobium sp.]|jgi:hypothetical protein|uniref:hypothetical protein n=1 Tax=Longimicrobium sp. TaxID=2029185 RepID=UPI002EDB3F61
MRNYLDSFSLMAQRTREFLPRYLWLAPIVSTYPLLVFCIWIYGYALGHTTGWSEHLHVLPTADTGVTSLGALLWGASVILFLSVAAASMVVLVSTVYGQLKEQFETRPQPATIVALLASFAVFFMLVFHPRSPLSGKPYYVTMQFAHGVLPGGTKHILTSLWVLTLVASLLVVGGAAATLAGLHASGRILLSLDRRDEMDDEAARQRLVVPLAARSRRLQTVLFAGAAVLVAGVVEIDALFHWAVGRANLTAYPTGTGTFIISAATVSTGTLFSLYLAFVYLPAALILRQQGMMLAERLRPNALPAAQAEWLEENGVGLSVATHVSTVVALMGPFLAGGPLNAIGHMFG